MEVSLEERIRQFQSTLTVVPPLNAAPIDWSVIDAQVGREEASVKALEEVATKRPATPQDLAEVLSAHPTSLRIIEAILGLPTGHLSTAAAQLSNAESSTQPMVALAEQIFGMGFDRFLREGQRV